MPRQEAARLEDFDRVQALYDEYLELARVGDLAQLLEADAAGVDAHRPETPLSVSVGLPRA